ncbi:unnamed protein product [Ambrosiozyma monospora]|uniref:Unnamed protein product n=1 Tax=Ambrosiozyma monospora TaxID=43982 RepID=A0ACB5U2N0_AMBMO|nr:unnamed protein product [Ambrosiozyma monospora]
MKQWQRQKKHTSFIFRQNTNVNILVVNDTRVSQIEVSTENNIVVRRSNRLASDGEEEVLGDKHLPSFSSPFKIGYGSAEEEAGADEEALEAEEAEDLDGEDEEAGEVEIGLEADDAPDLAGEDGEPELDGEDGEPELDGEDGEPDLAGDDGEPELAGDDGEPELAGDDGEPELAGDDGEPELAGDDGEPELAGDDGEPDWG